MQRYRRVWVAVTAALVAAQLAGCSSSADSASRAIAIAEHKLSTLSVFVGTAEDHAAAVAAHESFLADLRRINTDPPGVSSAVASFSAQAHAGLLQLYAGEVARVSSVLMSVAAELDAVVLHGLRRRRAAQGAHAAGAADAESVLISQRRDAQSGLSEALVQKAAVEQEISALKTRIAEEQSALRAHRQRETSFRDELASSASSARVEIAIAVRDMQRLADAVESRLEALRAQVKRLQPQLASAAHSIEGYTDLVAFADAALAAHQGRIDRAAQAAAAESRAIEDAIVRVSGLIEQADVLRQEALREAIAAAEQAYTAAGRSLQRAKGMSAEALASRAALTGALAQRIGAVRSSAARGLGRAHAAFAAAADAPVGEQLRRRVVLLQTSFDARRGELERDARAAYGDAADAFDGLRGHGPERTAAVAERLRSLARGEAAVDETVKETGLKTQQ